MAALRVPEMLPVAMAWPATAKTRRALPTCQPGAIRHKHEPFTYIPSFGDRTGLVPRGARSGCRVKMPRSMTVERMGGAAAAGLSLKKARPPRPGLRLWCRGLDVTRPADRTQ